MLVHTSDDVLDVRLEVGSLRQLARVVVVEIANRNACLQQPVEIGAVGVQRNVEDRDVVAGRRIHAPQQRDVALDAGDERRIARIDPAEAAVAHRGRRRRR